jgi:hypothetical protein
MIGFCSAQGFQHKIGMIWPISQIEPEGEQRQSLHGFCIVSALHQQPLER